MAQDMLDIMYAQLNLGLNIKRLCASKFKVIPVDIYVEYVDDINYNGHATLLDGTVVNFHFSKNDMPQGLSEFSVN